MGVVINFQVIVDFQGVEGEEGGQDMADSAICKERRKKSIAYGTRYFKIHKLLLVGVFLVLKNNFCKI